VGQLGEDVGKVDAGRGPGSIEGYQPDNLQYKDKHLLVKQIRNVGRCYVTPLSTKSYFRTILNGTGTGKDSTGT
jgi:hypothetical protein